MNDLWESAKLIPIQTGKDIVGGFDIGFDDAIPEATRDELVQFVYWVEDNYSLPVTLWVDFKYRHYLVQGGKKRVGSKFYWADFATFPVFDNFDDIPVIELPVRMEKRTMDEILASFIEAISYYFAWLTNLDVKSFTVDPALTEKILQTYKTRGE